MSKKQNKKINKKKKRKNSDYRTEKRMAAEQKATEQSSSRALQRKIKDINIILSIVLVVCALGVSFVKIPKLNGVIMIVLFVTLVTQQVLLIYSAYKENSKPKMALSGVLILLFALLAYKVFM